VKNRVKWLLRSITCFIKGHEDIVTYYNPRTGERDLGFTCARCGRPKLHDYRWLMK